MSLSRALRMTRWTPVAAILLGAACTHGDANKLITVDGDTLITNIVMSTQFAGGLPSGVRSVNKWIYVSFDPSISDAFGRATTLPANWLDDPTCYGTKLIRSSGPAVVATYQSPQRYLPAMPYRVTMQDGCGGGQSTNLIAEPGNLGNGAGKTVWEFWYNFNGAGPTGTRYVQGLARYALDVRGSLDIAEMLLTGAVTQPDSLVFRTGDFAPAGRTRRDAFTTNCGSINIVHPIAGANPHLLGSDTSRSGALDLDQTACAAAGEQWGNLGTVTSPIPTNNDRALGANQYNFYVIWEALPDSTPNYAKPVFREQVGPLLTSTGLVLNNTYGPFPTAAMTPAQLINQPGGVGRPDSVTVSASNLARLATGSVYQVWFTRTGTDSAAKATGKLYKIVGGVAVDSQASVSEFNPDTTTGATWRMVINYNNYVGLANFDAVFFGIAAAGANTRPAAQPLSAGAKKLAGQSGTSTNMTFGSFANGGAASYSWRPAGLAAGGITGRDLTAEISHLLRPPVGYFYNAWLRNASSGALLDLGPVTGPYPDYQPLTEADTVVAGTVNTVEIVQSIIRWTDPSTIADTVLTGRTNLGDFGTGTTVPATWNTTVCQYDLIQVRLEPKSRASGVTAPTVTIQGNNPRIVGNFCKKPAAL